MPSKWSQLFYFNVHVFGSDIICDLLTPTLKQKIKGAIMGEICLLMPLECSNEDHVAHNKIVINQTTQVIVCKQTTNWTSVPQNAQSKHEQQSIWKHA